MLVGAGHFCCTLICHDGNKVIPCVFLRWTEPILPSQLDPPSCLARADPVLCRYRLSYSVITACHWDNDFIEMYSRQYFQYKYLWVEFSNII